MDDRIDPAVLDELLRLRKAAYAPYSAHPVAAVVETDSSERFGGTNVEVAHFKSVCAEASALSAMVAAGQRSVKRVYVLGPTDRPCPPCGDCRQRLREFGSDATNILTVDDEGQVKLRRSLGQLLPDSFGPEHIPD